MSNSLKPTPAKSCDHCGALLVRRRKTDGSSESIPEFLARKYCSRSCANRMRATTPATGGKCLWCGKVLVRKVRPSGALESREDLVARKFCDQRCMGNHAAPEGAKPLSIANAGHNKARRKKKRIVCERCGSTRKMEVHHKDKDPTNNVPNNLEVLCEVCHKKHHNAERNPKTCRVCGTRHCAFGLCSKHYQRFKKYGDPLVKDSAGTRETPPL